MIWGSGSKPGRARQALKALRDEFGEADLYAAYEGKFLLQSGDPVAAREACLKAFEATRDRSEAVGKFVRHVAEGWLGVIDGNPFQAERCCTLASAIQVKGLIKEANPGPAFNKRDSFDEDFERWMRRNYPDE